MKEISSRENSIFRHALSLKRKKYRDRYQEYLVEGPNLIREALKEGVAVKSLLISSAKDIPENDKELLEHGSIKDRLCVLSGNIFAELSETSTTQGMIGICAMPHIPADTAAIFRPGGNLVVLDRLQDPGNIGTILRTADAAGFDMAIFIKGTADPYSQKIIRSAAGSLFRVPMMFVSDYDELETFLRKHDKRIIASSMSASRTLYEEDISHDCAIVVGNEGNGVADELLKRADMIVRIPMAGNTESLNASVACGILMYERIRRYNERSTTANPG